MFVFQPKTFCGYRMTTPIWQFVLRRPFLSINTFILWYFIAFTANIERHIYCCGGVALARRDFGGILESSFRHCWRCALRDNVYSINTSIWRGKELGIWELSNYLYNWRRCGQTPPRRSDTYPKSICHFEPLLMQTDVSYRAFW